MPIYQYQCDECGHLFEKLMKLSDPEPSECPECGADEPRRTIAQTAFQLKGAGWYVTDYKSSGTPAATAGKGKEDSASSSSDDSSSAAASSSEKGSSDTSDAAPSVPQKASTEKSGAA